MNTFIYTELIKRNIGYIDTLVQDKISEQTLLIAGCGIGSQLAICLARSGFRKFILADGDCVDTSNLNRQAFYFDQIGLFKAEALAANIKRINPQASVEIISENITSSNAKEIVKKCDLIIDTIDFLDLAAIVQLHDCALQSGKPIFSTFSVGFGAALIYIPSIARSHSWIRDIFNLPAQGPVDNHSYVASYVELFKKIAPSIDPEVVEVMQVVFKSMADGALCPAPQISAGAHSVAALASTAVINYLSGRKILTAPTLMIDNLQTVLSDSGLHLT